MKQRFARRTIIAIALWLAGMNSTSLHASSQQLYLDTLVDFEHYADGFWHTAKFSNAPADAGYFGDGSSGEGGIRTSCGVALAYAVLAEAFPDATNRAARLEKVRQALNYGANTHLSGSNRCADGKSWGHGWQSAYWGGHMGITCLVAQKHLPPDTVQAVKRAIADEATYRANIPPMSGWVNDTKAEENAWNSHIVAVAAAWMNTDANAGSWLRSAKQYLVNTHTVAHTDSDPLASWITTVTHYPDFALENHGFYHPGYKACSGEMVGDSWLMAKLANPAIAAELEPFATHDVLPAWTNFTYLLLDSGEMAFPAGEDWDLNDYEQNAYLAWITTHFNDPIARWADGRLAQLLRYHQQVNGDGRYVGPSSAIGFARESCVAYRTALSWLHWANARYPTGPSVAPGPAFLHMPHVGVIEQRGANGYFSICYGPQTNGGKAHINAMIEAPTAHFPNDVYTVTPRVPGVIGLGAMGNPTGARLVNLTSNGNTFTAEMQLTNGTKGTTEVYVDCTDETVAIVEVPHPAPGVVNHAAGSFSVGIENAPLNGGSRLVEWKNGWITITNLSGITRSVTNDWICVAGHYGMVCGPEGYFQYQAAKAYSHGAAQDTLDYMPADSLAPRYAVWFPGKDAAQTRSGASLVSWKMSDTNCVLNFPGPCGSVHRIIATRGDSASTKVARRAPSP